MHRPSVAVLAAAMLPAALSVASLPTAQAAPRATEKEHTATGTGGAVATVDADATRVGLEVLRKGGNAVDAAVAAAATLGVTEPYSAGIGGGGFFVYYDAAGGRVHTIDGRETAPAAMGPGAFVENGTPILFAEAVTSGLSVGVPGTPLTWQEALGRWGSISLAEALRPATQVASRGFVVDQTFHDQTAANADRFGDFTSTAKLFLPGGELPPVGSVFRNLDLAHTYRLLGREGLDVLYGGRLGREVVDTVQDPPVVQNANRVVRSGLMELSDLSAYTAPLREPTFSSYRGLDLYGMSVPSSGGIAVGETLNILEGYDLGSLDSTTALHAWFEASALAFADRNRYVGDVPGVPVDELLSQEFADERRCEIDLDAAAGKPVPPGVPDGEYSGCGTAVPVGAAVAAGGSTTHLSTADRWGNVVSYTLTIEQTGGSGIVVPGRGFLLNNELTDFNFTPTHPDDPNLPGPGKRPRSSMSPTIVLDDGQPLLAVGSPGGATIITTVEQVLLNRIDFGMTLPEAVVAPRASQRNVVTTNAEPAFVDEYGPALTARGHTLVSTAEIGAVAAIELLPGGGFLAAAEPVRRGGGSAGVVRPG
jgi:gamma-glutamyltranspeptidase / glutathione hydrolase